MKIAAIIPARMASIRFPGKPLAKICGIPMIEHVRRRVSLCKKLDYVIVATCDKEILNHLKYLKYKHNFSTILYKSPHRFLKPIKIRKKIKINIKK